MDRIQPEMHPLLNVDIVQALHDKKVFTVSHFIKTDPHLISKITRLGFKEVLELKEIFLKKYAAKPINGFEEYKNMLKNTAILSTGLKNLDGLLDGGLHTGNIYEICGAPAAGKTQFVLSLIKNTLVQNDQQIFVLDTKHDFVAKRLAAMLPSSEASSLEKCMSKVLVQRPSNRFELINSLYEIKTQFENGHFKQLRLIIIDSLTTIVRQSDEIGANNVFLNELANVMRFIASKYHAAFLITNLITNWFKNDGFKENEEQALIETIACGKYWANVPNFRLKIKKVENNRFAVCRLLYRCVTPREASKKKFVILTDVGFRDE